MTDLHLLINLHLDLIKRNVTRTFDHSLNIIVPGNGGQFTQSLQLRELSFIARVRNRAGTQTVTKRKADVVLAEDLTDIGEALVKKILLVILDHPLGQNGTAPANNTGYAVSRHRDVLDEYAGVNGHVIDALLCLLLDNFKHQ